MLLILGINLNVKNTSQRPETLTPPHLLLGALTKATAPHLLADTSEKAVLHISIIVIIAACKYSRFQYLFIATRSQVANLLAKLRGIG